MQPSPFICRSGWLFVPQTAVLVPLSTAGLGRVYVCRSEDNKEGNDWAVVAAEVTVYEGTKDACFKFVARLAAELLGEDLPAKVEA